MLLLSRHHRHQQNLSDYPNIEDWFGRLEQRPAVQRVREIARKYTGVDSSVTQESRDILFRLS